MHQKVSMNKKKRIPQKKYNKTEKSQQKLSQQ